MPTPGLTDIYAFGDWLKREYIGSLRKALLIEPLAGGLIRVTELPPQKEERDAAASDAG